LPITQQPLKLEKNKHRVQFRIRLVCVFKKNRKALFLSEGESQNIYTQLLLNVTMSTTNYVMKLLLKMIKQKVAKWINFAKSGHAVFFLTLKGVKVYNQIIKDQNLLKFLDQVQAIFLFLSLPWLLCYELELKSDLRISQFYVHRVLCPGPNVIRLLRLYLTNVCNKQECTSLASFSSLV
jgi:hypothetical protein